MDKPKNTKKRFYLFIILIPIIPILINIYSVEAQLAQTNECIVTLKPTNAITSNLSPNEIIDKLETHFLLSASITNNEDTPINVRVPKGTIFFNPPSDIRTLDTYDSTGESFTHIIEDGYILNSEFTRTLDPLSSYDLTLALTTDPIVDYDEEEKALFIDSSLTPSISTNITLNIPKNFTILECTSNYYHEATEQYNSFKWIVAKDEIFSLLVKFLPFSKAPITKSIIFNIDAPEVFPTRSTLMTSSFTHVFESPKIFSNWTIDHILAYEISFPVAEKVTVDQVFDSMGECIERSRPLVNMDEDYRGYFFVDNENSKVIVYPRYHEFSDYYEYSVEAIFNFQNEIKYPGNLLPYQNQYNFSITKIATIGNWKQDLTGNFEVIFSLPSGTDPIWANEDFLEGMKNGKRIVKFIYTSPKTIPTKNWVLTIDVESLRTLLLIQVISVVILSLFLPLCLFLKNQSLRVLIAQIGIPAGIKSFDLPYMIEYWYDFISIGGTKLVYLVLFVLELILLSLIFFLAYKKFKETLKIEIEKTWDLILKREDWGDGNVNAWVAMKNPYKSNNVENVGTSVTTIKSINAIKKSMNPRKSRIAALVWKRDYYLSKFDFGGNFQAFPISDPIEPGHRVIFSLPFVKLLDVLLENDMLNLEKKYQGRFALIIEHVLGKDKSNSFKLYLSEELRQFIIERRDAFGRIIVRNND